MSSAAAITLSADVAGRLGATPLDGDRGGFRVWAPSHESLVVVFPAQHDRAVELDRDGKGYFRGIVPDVPVGTPYMYQFADGARRPDPASRAQVEGVHGPSLVVDTRFDWTDEAWCNPPLAEHVFYELHVGTFTEAGTFEGVGERLKHLVDLGITAIELMPIAQFPGERNWGYDGVLPFAAQRSYGGVRGLQVLVNECHCRGLAVYLDVVYNHLGPEGNYLRDFGPYFTDRYRTPWGDALNFDGAGSDHVREYFIQNALYWVRECHIDGLRLDAVHAINDESAYPFLEELTERVQGEAERGGRRVHVIAESASNDARLIRDRADGGLGMDGQWSDDFHHALHALVTGEREGYYASYGTMDHLTRVLRNGYAYTGQHSTYHRRRHGRSTVGVPPSRFIVFAQNHDQIGNRLNGERLSALVDFESQKLAMGMTLLSPFVPLLFMGEDWGETAPFLYFVSHGEPALIEAVRRGRREEFAAFAWDGEPPDPQGPDTFARSRLDWSRRRQSGHRVMLSFVRALIRLRRETAVLQPHDDVRRTVVPHEEGQCVEWRLTRREDFAIMLANIAADPQDVAVDPLTARVSRLIDSSDTEWDGPGSTAPRHIDRGAERASIRLQPHAIVAYRRSES